MNVSSVRVRKPIALLGAGLSLFAAHAAFGQTPTTTSASNDENPIKLEKIVVTGSNIPLAAEALAVPVNVVDFKIMENSGVSGNTLELLRKVAPNISGIGDENATISTGTNQGGASVNIKGLPTLVLVNGRRVVDSPVGSTSYSQFVDLNMIPPAAIDRIEVLENGASAIYGSDAVGGVINILLKKNYNGWEIGGHYGYSPNTGHYSERSGYMVGGVSNDKTSITVALDYHQHDAIFMNTRSYTNPIYGTYSLPGVIDVYNNTTGDDIFYTLKPGLNAPTVAPGGQTIDQLVASGDYVEKSPDEVFEMLNLAKGQTLIQYMKRYSAMANFEHKVFGDHLVAFGDLLYSRTKTWSQLNAQPVVPYLLDPWVTVNVFGYDSYPPPAGTNYVPSTAPTNPFSADWLDQGQAAPESAPGFADGSGYAVAVRNRFISHPRVYQNDSSLFRVTGGFRGDITEDLHWEAGATLNRATLNYTNPGVLNTIALNDALQSGTINPFARTQSETAFDGVIGTAFSNELSTLNSFDFKINGTPFELPAGKLGFAVGTSYVRETLSAVPDVGSLPNSSGTTTGWANATTFQAFDAARDVFSGFAEISAPITSAKQAITGAYAINTDFAVRYDKYNGKVGSSTTPQVNVSWAPVDDQFKFRASWGKSFIAPQLSMLYGPVSSGASDSINYTTLAGVAKSKVQFQSTGGSNPDLKPTTAKAWNAGFVYTPKTIKGLSITIDYSQIKQTDIISNVPQATIIQDVETNGTASPYASLIRYNSPNGGMVTGPGGISSHSNQSVYIINNLVNLAGTKVNSTDINVDYKWSTASAGRFELSSTWTWYNSYKLQLIPTEAYYEYSGQASVNGGTIPKWRTYTTLDWSFKGFDAVAGVTYVQSVTDVGDGGTNQYGFLHVPSFTAFDLAVSYDMGQLHLSKWLDGFKVTIGANNLFNRMPPLAPQAFSDTNADIGTYDGAIGRMYYVNASYKF